MNCGMRISDCGLGVLRALQMIDRQSAMTNLQSAFCNPQQKASHHTSAPEAVERVLTRFFSCVRAVETINRSSSNAQSGKWKMASTSLAR